MLIIRLAFITLFSVVMHTQMNADSSIREMVNNYVNKYKSIAISEMERSGIPASIKLAQGLLESDFGRSNLATKANNHFGIKCGSSWTGNTFLKEDDDYKNGKLIKSCFRSFSSVEESYTEHSEFLLDGAKKSRYGFLFEYDSNDFRSWAKGLKKAGYATDPKYPQKLMSIIVKYELFKLDEGGFPANRQSDRIIASKSDATTPPAAVKLMVTKPVKKEEKEYRKSRVNDVKFIVTRESDSVKKIASMFKMSPWLLLEFNEGIASIDTPLSEGDRLFLEPKKKSFKSKKFHKVRSGQTLFGISQHYGISLKSLCSRNGLNADDQPLKGEKIQLKGIRLKKSIKVGEKKAEPEFLFEDGGQ